MGHDESLLAASALVQALRRHEEPSEVVMWIESIVGIAAVFLFMWLLAML